MKFKVYNHTTHETTQFNSFNEFVYWFNYVDEHCNIQEVQE